MNNVNPFSILNFFNFSQVSFAFKAGFLILDLFMLIFLLVVIKQIFSMDHIVHDSNDFAFIKTFSFLLFIISLSLFIVCLVIL